jgi:hypothetical protein
VRTTCVLASAVIARGAPAAPARDPASEQLQATRAPARRRPPLAPIITMVLASAAIARGAPAAQAGIRPVSNCERSGRWPGAGHWFRQLQWADESLRLF